MGEAARDAGNFTAPQLGKLKVFISYCRDDLDFADQLVAGLELCGFDGLIDRHEISGGEAWQQRLGNLIREADSVAFVLSPMSAGSKICAWEVDEAVRMSKRILPVVCAPLGEAELPPRLQDLNFIFFYGEAAAPGSGFGAGLAQLVAALNTDIEWVREHTRLLARATEWEKGGRPANRLLSGTDIVDAKAWAARRPKDAPQLTALHLDFIRASEEEEASRASAERKQLDDMAAAHDQRAKALQAAENALREATEAQRARDRAQRYITWGSAISAVILASVAVLAVSQFVKANQNEALALGNLREARITQSRQLVGLAEKYAEGGDQTTRLLLALEALPSVNSRERKDWPFVRRAMANLDSGLGELRERQIFRGNAFFSRDGKLILSTNAGDSPRLWDSETGKELRTLGGPSDDADGGVRFSPDGKTVVMAKRHYSVQRVATSPKRVFEGYSFSVWDVASGVKLSVFGDPAPLMQGAEYSPDGKRVLMVLKNDAPRLYTLTGNTAPVMLGEPDHRLRSGSFNAAGDKVLAISADKIARIWDASTGKVLTVIGESGQTFASAAFSPDGKLVQTVADTVVQRQAGERNVSASSKTIRIWDANTGKEQFVLGRPEQAFDNVRFSRDADPRLMLTTSIDKTIRLWNLTTRGEPLLLGASEQAISTILFSGDAKLVLTASADKDKVLIRDTATGKVAHELGGEPVSVSGASFNRDGSLALLTLKDDAPRLWEIKLGTSRALGDSEVPQAYFSPDGEFVLTMSTGKNARLWPTRPKEEPKDAKARQRALAPIVLGGHEDSISGAGFSADGKYLLTRSSSDSRLWLVDRRARLDAQTALKSAAILAKGETLQSFQDVLAAAQKLAQDVKEAVPRCLTVQQRIDSYIDPEPPSWCITLRKYPYDDSRWQNWPAVAKDPSIAIKLGDHAWYALLDGEDRIALSASNLGLRFDPDATWIKINRAAALMLSGDTVAARKMYLESRGTTIVNNMRWEDAVLGDFADLRKNGRDHALMTEIEQFFRSSPATPASKP